MGTSTASQPLISSAVKRACHVPIRFSSLRSAAVRRRQVDRALARDDYVGVGERGVLALTLVAMALALGTLVVIIVQP